MAKTGYGVFEYIFQKLLFLLGENKNKMERGGWINLLFLVDTVCY